MPIGLSKEAGKAGGKKSFSFGSPCCVMTRNFSCINTLIPAPLLLQS
jgi:hypothetical protein